IVKKVVNDLSLEGEVIVEKTKTMENGHYTTNFPLINSKKNQKNPMELGELIVNTLKKESSFSDVVLAKPGFINLTLNDNVLQNIVKEILVKQDDFGRGDNKDFKYNLELVSANPTGFLHIGHAR